MSLWNDDKAIITTARARIAELEGINEAIRSDRDVAWDRADFLKSRCDCLEATVVGMGDSCDALLKTLAKNGGGLFRYGVGEPRNINDEGWRKYIEADQGEEIQLSLVRARKALATTPTQYQARVERLVRAAKNVRAGRYPDQQGFPELKAALAEWENK
jgi:hypothetical protein